MNGDEVGETRGEEMDEEVRGARGVDADGGACEALEAGLRVQAAEWPFLGLINCPHDISCSWKIDRNVQVRKGSIISDSRKV